MLEAEVAFVRSLDQLCDVVEAGVRGTLASLLESNSWRAERTRADLTKIAALQAAAEAELEGTKADTADLLAVLADTAKEPFARITYSDAVALLSEQHVRAPFAIKPDWHAGLSSEHEKWLSGTHFGKPVFVTHYPAEQKPFYMLPSDACADPPSSNAPGPTVAAFDLLFPGIGEMAGGSLREHRLDALLGAIRKAGLKEEDYSWYLDLRRFGTVPHGGWGMGWERWVCWVTGVPNVRDVVAFPRWAGSCRF
jgi:asparaginyl-tRNA synthetase